MVDQVGGLFGDALVGLLAAGANGPEAASSADSFNIPEDVSIRGPSDTNLRKATVKVNGTIITGTDVDQRVALILASNEAQPSPEELQRLRLQVFRSLIDETLQIQEAAALEIAVTPQEVDDAYARVAASERFNRSPEALGEYLISIGSSPTALKRQIEGELAWDRLLRRNVAPFVQVSASEVNELYERIERRVPFRARAVVDDARDSGVVECNARRARRTAGTDDCRAPRPGRNQGGEAIDVRVVRDDRAAHIHQRIDRLRTTRIRAWFHAESERETIRIILERCGDAEAGEVASKERRLDLGEARNRRNRVRRGDALVSKQRIVNRRREAVTRGIADDGEDP